MNYLLHLPYFSIIRSFHVAVFLYCTDDDTSIMSKCVLLNWHSIVYFTIARNSGNILLTYRKAFLVRHSSEHKTSDSDRKVDRNMYSDAVARDGVRLIDPKGGQLGTIHHFLEKPQ